MYCAIGYLGGHIYDVQLLKNMYQIWHTKPLVVKYKVCVAFDAFICDCLYVNPACWIINVQEAGERAACRNAGILLLMRL